jgi:surfeit locus 1 family protein
VYRPPGEEQFPVSSRLRAAGRAFAPFLSLVLVVALAAVFVRLGLWQWGRGVQREAQWAQFAHGTDQLVELGARPASELPLYQRVSVSGALDGAHQFLLDNRTFQGRAGFEVLTPLERTALPMLLVDRGWVPFGGVRAQLPDVTLETSGAVTLTGRLANLPSAGLASGRAAPAPGGLWPKITSYPSVEELAAALGAPVSSRILLLDPRSPYGYERDWQPPGLPPLRHFGYAVQWWSFAVLALIAWGVLHLNPRRSARGLIREPPK